MTRTTRAKKKDTGIKSEDKQPVSVKKETKHKIVKDEEIVKENDDAAISVPFEVGKFHKMALLKLLFCHHSGQELTYKELSDAMGVGEKTKAWQCEAWRDLKKNEYIVPSGTDKKLKLSEKGVELATSFASDEELADYKMPETNEEHHEKIKSKLMRQDKAKKMGPKIFDLLVENKDNPMTNHEMAAKFNTLADSHSFFYGFQALKKMGLVETTGESKKPDEEPMKIDEEEPKEEEDAINDETTDGDDKPKKKKKKKKSKKSMSGGKLWKLSEKAFLVTAKENAPVKLDEE
ncbi:expressed unknown protein [Seminavis robusta]|uniref:Uncharacterized protein n=1 Tax=Seminavis robusta TaxID=568900 RepID=A0A9N8E522_9STRA|nr:expressed unknown protein [Seminavis robusta]|eukprot:Sro508_g156820.1 n/a (291) ;mRNA; r:42182-43140